MIRKINFKCCLLSLGMLLFGSFSLFSQKTISGVISDDGGMPLIGATVSEAGTSNGTVTDINGAFSLTAPSDATIEVSYTGYATKRFNLAETTDFNISLSDDALALDEIVVTGTFSGRSQKNSPLSMTALNSKQLAYLNNNSQADVLRNIPGIAAEGGGGEVASNVFVRGMPSGGQYQFTPLQVDGLPTISTFGLNSSAHDVYFRNDIGINSLEFVRGGASTLFGAGSVAGIINYRSITGTATQQNKVGLEWAEGGRAKADFLTAGPLSDNLFYAFSGFYRYDEGPLETGLNTKGYQMRGNLKKLFNNGKSSFTVYAQAIDDNVQFYLPYPLANNDGNFERPTGNDGETVYTMLTGEAADFSFDTPFGRFKSPIEQGVITKGGYLMADLKHSFGNDWRLNSKVKTSRYDHWFNLFLDGDGVHNTPETQGNYLSDRGLPADATFTYVDNGSQLGGSDLLFQNRVLDRARPMEEITGEFNLTKTMGDHNITIGTYNSNTRAEDNNWIWNFVGDFSNSPRMVGITYTDSLGNAQTYSTDGFISGGQTSNRYHTSTKNAVYLADEYKGDKFSFDVGVRVERAKGFISRETGVASNTFQKGTVSTTGTAIALAGLYELNNSTNVYANFSSGYFFPELRGVKFSSKGAPQTYEPEGVLQGELGAKVGTKSLSATGAIFYVALNDRRSIDFENDGSGGVREVVSVQSTQTVGFEGTANYNIGSGLNANLGFTFQDHGFTEVEGNPEQEGNWLRRQPQMMGNIGLTYDNNGFDANVSHFFVGKRYANDANTVELDPYGITRLNAGYTFGLGESNESLRLGVSVFNLLDVAGITEGSPRQGNSQTGATDFFVGRPILPRRVMIKALFSF